MLKFNNTNIFTGYLKQLLTSFNLPSYHIYTKENQQYHDWAVKERAKIIKEAKKQNPNVNISSLQLPPLEKNIFVSVEKIDKNGIKLYPENLKYFLYIKDEQLQYYIKDSLTEEPHWKIINKQYYLNKKDLNYTKNFIIKNNIYDTYTHEYLGNFLRFLRDFNNLDLMSMYNCFTNVLCPQLNIQLNQYISMQSTQVSKSSTPSSAQIAKKIITFNTEDTNYKIYMLPVKFFKDYTIAIDCDSPVEMCCGFYGQYQDTRTKFAPISGVTYQKFNSLHFNCPVLYSKLFSKEIEHDLANTEDYGQNEKNLKLFIKLPANNKSSITILEGDYLNYNNVLNEPIQNSSNHYQLKKRLNHYVTNYETVLTCAEVSDKQKPLKTISLPDISDRPFIPISELQLLKMNTGISYPIADRLIEYLSGNVITSEESIADNIRRVQYVMNLNHINFDVDGAWDNKIKPILYDQGIYNATHNYLNSNDILGYVDKEVESSYKGYKKLAEVFRTKTQIINHKKIVHIIECLDKTITKVDLKSMFSQSDEIIIEPKAFAYCTNLVSVILPVSISQIKSNAFLNCDKFKLVYYAGTADDWANFKKAQTDDDIKNLLENITCEQNTKVPPIYHGQIPYTISNADIYPDIYKDTKNY